MTAQPDDHPGATGSEVRATPLFGTSLRGIVRLTWSGLLAWRKTPRLLALVLLSPALSGLALMAASAHRSEGFRVWVLHLHANFMVPIACLLSGGSMIRDEIQEGTLTFLLTRPIRRARLLLLKYVCHTLWSRWWWA